MKHTNKTAGETANQGFYWIHELTDCCEALRAAQLGHLIRLLDDYVCGCVNPEELELADPEVATAFRFIASSLKNVSHE